MIPALVALSGAPWMVLPVGIHPATLDEVEIAFAVNQTRRMLFNGLVSAAISLRNAGCGLIYLNGSYVTAKPVPGDYDALWDPAGIDIAKLDPVFLNFDDNRLAQKTKFKGEFFPANAVNFPSQPFVEFFQVDRFTGGRKGILSVALSTDPVLTGKVQS
jgi:hypothetical protein